MENRPLIVDPLDEAEQLPASLRAELLYQGMIFITEIYDEGELFEYGTLIARDMEHARRRAEERGLGEVVAGLAKRIFHERA